MSKIQKYLEQEANSFNRNKKGYDNSLICKTRFEFVKTKTLSINYCKKEKKHSIFPQK